jgi:hypothetical protein
MDGVATDPQKVVNVQKWPIPQNLKELRGFLGLSRYYRKVVRHYSIINQPLTQFLHKGVPFVWSKDMHTTFNTLKQALTSAPVLALSDFSKRFKIETDASGAGVGAVLL